MCKERKEERKKEIINQYIKGELYSFFLNKKEIEQRNIIKDKKKEKLKNENK